MKTLPDTFIVSTPFSLVFTGIYNLFVYNHFDLNYYDINSVFLLWTPPCLLGHVCNFLNIEMSIPLLSVQLLFMSTPLLQCVTVQTFSSSFA